MGRGQPVHMDGDDAQTSDRFQTRFPVCFTPSHSNPTRLLEMVNGGLNLDAQNDTETD